MNLKIRYFLILDDAEEIYDHITPENFKEFLEGLPSALDVKNTKIDENWARKFGAVVLPKLFIEILQYPHGGMGTGFVMHRLIETGLAKVVGGKFIIIK